MVEDRVVTISAVAHDPFDAADRIMTERTQRAAPRNRGGRAATRPPRTDSVELPDTLGVGPRWESPPQDWKDFLDRWRASALSSDEVLARHVRLMADIRRTLMAALLVVVTLAGIYAAARYAGIAPKIGTMTVLGAVSTVAAARVGQKVLTRRRRARTAQITPAAADSTNAVTSDQASADEEPDATTSG
ncbi:hypothetical protein AB0L82_35430 [Nocardia sp. NPDC052001]|uniref:hypothetical protein n=1 Tax=Nocardia sp. NPDC052001 TaxID=3154853 RepID=UPI00341E7DF0